MQLLPTGPSQGIQEIEPSKIFCNAIVEHHDSASLSEIPASGAGIWIVDRNMRVVWMNNAMEELYGAREAILGRNCFAAFRGRNSKCADCLPTKAFETGSIISGFISRTKPDGTPQHYQLIEAPLFDERGEIFRVMEIVLDITRRTHLEQSLQKSEASYRALFEHTGAAVVVIDTERKILQVNRQFEELSGYPKKELEGSCQETRFIHPRDRARLDDLTTRPSSYEFAFIDRWGNEKQLHASVGLLPDGRFICSLIDLTEKHRLEQEVRSKEQFLANVLRHSVEAIVAIDAEGKIRSWNHGAELMFGTSPHAILGKAFTSLFAPSFRKSQKMKRAWGNFEAVGILRNFAVEGVTREGRTLLLEVTRTAIQDADGKQLGSSAILRDVTEKLKAEQRMIHQEKMMALGEIAATIAHEVKNPLNSMVINMEILKSRLADVAPAKRGNIDRYLDVLTSEIRRLNGVVAGVLDFSRPIPGQFQTLRVEETLRAVAELLSPQAKKQNVKVFLKVASDLPPIEGIEDHLKQAFFNLALNAIQAMPNGGRLELTAERDPSRNVAVKVRDTGIGIPRQHYKKIFDLYFSTKSEGSGLGLPMVKRLIASHGGSVRLTSKVNHGTTFYLTFPTA